MGMEEILRDIELLMKRREGLSGIAASGCSARGGIRLLRMI